MVVIDECDLLYLIREELQHLNVDELRGVLHMCRKIRRGAEKHGHLSLATDVRNWVQERRDEHKDALWYAMFEEICKEDV